MVVLCCMFVTTWLISTLRASYSKHSLPLFHSPAAGLKSQPGLKFPHVFGPLERTLSVYTCVKSGLAAEPALFIHCLNLPCRSQKVIVQTGFKPPKPPHVTCKARCRGKWEKPGQNQTMNIFNIIIFQTIYPRTINLNNKFTLYRNIGNILITVLDGSIVYMYIII